MNDKTFDYKYKQKCIWLSFQNPVNKEKYIITTSYVTVIFNTHLYNVSIIRYLYMCALCYEVLITLIIKSTIN